MVFSDLQLLALGQGKLWRQEKPLTMPFINQATLPVVKDGLFWSSALGTSLSSGQLVGCYALSS